MAQLHCFLNSGSESISQVYGSLHTYLQENQKALSEICEIILHISFDFLTLDRNTFSLIN